ncbi:MAG: hypothetical protein QOG53_996 [Frankiales bacterium]|jgi:hypothetical protein|nr:hypothetical protein [Frankiales bacterium]
MNRWQRGWQCTLASFRIARDVPSIVGFSLIALLAQAGIDASYIFGVAGGTHVFDGTESHTLFALIPVYLIGTICSTFSAAAVVALADLHLRGEPVSVPTALSRVATHAPALLGWSLLTGTVGLIIRAIEQRLSFAGRIIAALVGVIWTLASLMVVPVIMLERTGPFSGLRRSSALFRQRWGESVVSDLGQGLVIFALSLPVLLLACFGFVGGITSGIVTLVIAFIVLAAVSSALSAILSLVLYRYVVDGVVLDGFSESNLQNAFRPRRSWRDSSERYDYN